MSKLESTKILVNEKSVMAVIRASRPSFRNSHDKIAFVVHASFLAAGYFLNATGTPAFSHDALTSSSTDENGIDQWNEYAYNYAFVYIYPERGSKKVLVKCLAESGKLIVDAWSGYGSSPFHLEIDVQDYAEESTETNYTSHFKNLKCLLKSIYKVILINFSDSLEVNSSTHASSYTTGLSCSSHEASSSSIQPSSSRKSVPSIGSYLFPELGAGAYPPRIVFPPIRPFLGNNLFPGYAAEMYPPRNDFGYGRATRIGQLDPWFFGGIGARFDQHGRSGGLGFELNQRSMFWWHWWRVWFHKRTIEVVEVDEEEEEEKKRDWPRPEA
ncbi:hypothetical protein LguiB_015590 [Lonicera macranthoides]